MALPLVTRHLLRVATALLGGIGVAFLGSGQAAPREVGTLHLLKSCPPEIQDLLHETVERDHSTLAQEDLVTTADTAVAAAHLDPLAARHFRNGSRERRRRKSSIRLDSQAPGAESDPLLCVVCSTPTSWQIGCALHEETLTLAGWS